MNTAHLEAQPMPAEACSEIGADDCQPGELIDSGTAEVLRVYGLLLGVIGCALLALHFAMAVTA